MIKYIFLLIVLTIIGVILYMYKSKENFLDYSSIYDENQINNVFMYPSFILQKAEREERDKFLEDESHILKQPRPNKLLRGVDELMAVKYNGDNIYDATQSLKGKEYTHNLTNW